MRALVVIAEMGSGGAETVVSVLSQHARNAGNEVVVASSGGWRADGLAAGGLRTLDVPLASPGPLALGASVRRIRREAARHPVDLLHAHNVRASLAAYLGTRAARRRRPPLVTTVHGLDPRDYPVAARVLSRTSDLVVAVSRDVEARLVAAGLEPHRVRIVENAVVTAPRAEREDVRRELGLEADRPVALCVARLARPKRLDLLLEAWASPLVPADAVLLVAGDGPERPGLELAARALGDRVRMLGDRRDVDRLLAAADLLVLPSDREGLPMAVLEGMAAGTPVVASAVGGLQELEGAVELVAPGRVDALAQGLARVLTDPGRAAELSAAAAELVEGRFSSARMCATYESVYDELLGGRMS